MKVYVYIILSLSIVLGVGYKFYLLNDEINQKEKEILKLKSEIEEKTSRINMLEVYIEKLKKDIGEKDFYIQTLRNDYSKYQVQCNKIIESLKKNLNQKHTIENDNSVDNEFSDQLIIK